MDKLEKSLLRRYGERKDKSAAEWRVSMRPMMPGETYADFAAGLRDVVGRNNVSERVLLAQFYRCLDKTTRKLVRQEPRPKTLEEAVDKATEIDDPIDNVAQGMMNIGLPWATAPRPYLIPMVGTTGQTIPGIGGMGLPTGMLNSASANDGTTTRKDMEHVALFTNPQGDYNKATGTWDPPPGHLWNGKYWYEPRKTERKRAAAKVMTSNKATSKKPVKAQSRRETDESSSDEPDDKPRKRHKAAVKKAGSGTQRTVARVMTENKSGHESDGAGKSSGSECFHCGQSGQDSQATGQHNVPTIPSALRVISLATMHEHARIPKQNPAMIYT
ncbi:unnamed protein product [Phytophthora fragariaefolia]|uniref:Unnamed protein product n=1 Tax=Phytophthora fragariaefolia TaxID=1490495 RepID=A0A9W7CZ16_9STRA|nr:unnamed protein product [Phytophthora fragariaefolia]